MNPAPDQTNPADKPAALALRRLLGCQPDQLPTLPVAAMEVMRLAKDPEAGLEPLVRVLRRDPPLAANLLKVANSPLYRTRHQITDLERAVLVLGFKEVGNLALGLSLLTGLGGAKALKRRLQRADIWRHSLAVATICEQLARKQGLAGEGFYTLGLLHDLGKVALDAFRPREYTQVLESLEHRRASFAALEGELLRCDHAFVGENLLAYWELPEFLVMGVGRHHLPWTAGPHEPLARLAMLADLVSYQLGLGCLRQAQGGAYADTLDETASAYVAAQGWDPAALAQELAEAGIAEAVGGLGEGGE